MRGYYSQPYVKRVKEKMSEELKLPDEWCEILGVVVLDPDGWRFKHRNLEPKDWKEPITESEFTSRRMWSTTMLKVKK